jgi:hypothetical protein
MMAMRLPMRNASSRSWLTKMMVLLQTPLEFEQLILKAGPDQRIESGEWLVHQKDRCTGGKGTGKAHPLLHAAREFVDLAAGPLGQVDEFELLGNALLALGIRHLRKLQPEADIVGNSAPGQQGKLLEHHRDGLHTQVAQRLGVALVGIDRAGLALHRH